MNTGTGFRPVVRTDLLRRDIGHEAVIWSPLRRDPVGLDAVATVLLDIIDGVATVDELVEDVRDTVGVEDTVARARVEQVIATLADAGALASSPPPPVPERQRELFINPPSS